jgi:GTP-binding protein
MEFSLAIVGRPNVGKSTLFNRMAGKRLALVDDMPGLTRDRKEAMTEVGKFALRLIDTAGLEESDAGSIAHRMREQSERAIADSDMVLFIIDARAGVTPADEIFATLARESGKPLVLAANKCEGRASEAGYYDAFRLGLGEPVAISAEHGLGMDDLYQGIGAILNSLAGEGEALPISDEPGAEGNASTRPLKLAIAGRPNTGKSTLVNALLGEERMITGPEPGLTRDAVSSRLAWSGREIDLYDTAGLRRKARVTERTEKLAVGDTLNAIRFAEVVIALFDADCALERQDLSIADMVSQEGRALVLGINKWDLVEDKAKRLKELKEEVERVLPQVKGVPVVSMSALSGQGLDRLMTAVFSVYETWNRRLPTAALNRWFSDAVERHAPPAVQGKRIKLRYITQPNARPPTFVAFCSRADDVPAAYVRYLVNDLRQTFNMWGSPIRFHLRSRENPYAPNKGGGKP